MSPVPGLLVLGFLLLGVGIPAIGYAISPGRRWRRGAIVAIVVVGCLALLGVVSGLVTASAGVAGLPEAQQREARAQKMAASLRSAGYAVGIPLAVWLGPFIVGEVRRRRAREPLPRRPDLQ